MTGKATMRAVQRLHANQLLHNRFVVVLGDSIQRSVYKDLVLILQKDKYLSLSQLKSKGEFSFENDCLVEGGRLAQMNNGTSYREVRQYRIDHHLVRFYFVTQVYSHYMESVLADFEHGIKPDVVIVNSCVWDVSRYSRQWTLEYRENLNKFFSSLKRILPEESLVLWNMTMPLGKKIKGGFLVPEIQHMGPMLRFDVIEANYFGATLADQFGFDVLDLHYQFRFSLEHRMPDGVHWNAVAHRAISALLLDHIADAWGVELPKFDQLDTDHKLTVVENQQTAAASTSVRYKENSYKQPTPKNRQTSASSVPSRHQENSYKQPTPKNRQTSASSFTSRHQGPYYNNHYFNPPMMPPIHYNNGPGWMQCQRMGQFDGFGPQFRGFGPQFNDFGPQFNSFGPQFSVPPHLGAGYPNHRGAPYCPANNWVMKPKHHRPYNPYARKQAKY